MAADLANDTLDRLGCGSVFEAAERLWRRGLAN